MIISRQKDFKDILRALKEKNIFIIGCGKCATKLRVGGEPEVLEMGKKLKRAGKNVTGWVVISSACSINSWKDVLSQNSGIGKSGALLVMSCGAGVSVISMLADSMNRKFKVYPALDTESLGGICGEETVEELCGMCGDCNIRDFGGICSVIQCPKGLKNGPCGGATDGNCETGERKCAWDMIYDRLERLGTLGYLEVVREPQDHTKRFRRQKH